MDTIPLHRLPDEAFLRVLKTMEIYDQLTYSLCSKNTKKVIKSLNLEAEQINLCISDVIEIEFRFRNSIVFRSEIIYEYNFANEEFVLQEAIEVWAYELVTDIEWEWNFYKFGIKEWLNHFCEVLHQPRIDNLCFSDDLYLYGDDEIEGDFIKPVQKVIEGLYIASFALSEHIAPEFTKKALESFYNYEILYIGRVPFDNNEVHKMDKFLIQNLSEVFIPEAERLRIDQVLISNSKRIEAERSMFTDKDLNRLLKLWIRGCNPRLKNFYTTGQPLHGSVSLDERVILRGIKHGQIPLDSQEVYKKHVYEDYYEETKLAGGHRIWRFDGIKAVVLIEGHSFELIVD